MSILGNIARKNLALDDEKAWNPSLWNLIGNQTPSGENVTEETALTYSAFWNAVYIIAETLSALPLHLMKQEDKVKSRVDDIDLYYLMHDQPNPFMTSLIFREVLAAHILTWGNSYAEIVRNRMGQIVELWPIPPNKIKTIEIKDDNNLWYEIQVGDDTTWLPREQILHIPGLGFDGFVGYSVVGMARKSIALGMAMETFGSNYFGQGTHPGVIVSHPDRLDSVTHANMRQSLTETYSGLGNTHRLMLLEDGMKIEKIGIPPNDSQFLESRQFQVPEIARWFNLPPHKLKDLTKSSFNNIESEQISFVVDSILPWVVRHEQCYNIQLLTKDQRRKKKYYYKHNMEGLLRANSKDRGDFYKVMVGSTIMTPNEVREKEDLNPHKSKYADDLFVPLNSTPLGRLEEIPIENQESNPDENSEEDPGDDEDANNRGKNSSRGNKILKLGEAL